MNVEDEEWVKHALVEAERRECTSKILDMSWKEAIPPGNNFVSDIFRVKVNVMKNSGETEEKSVIYKIIPVTDNKLPGKDVREMGMFKNEARMYTETLYQIEKIFRKYEPGGNPLWPTFYGVKGDYDGYLMEDLRPYGFKGVDRREELNFDHCKLALKYLAKFHAGGVKLLEKNPGAKNDLKTKSFFCRDIDSCKHHMSAVTKTIPNVIRKWPQEWHEYIEGVAGLEGAFVTRVFESFEKQYSIKTVCHGDLWTTNILFRYDAEGQPRDVRFLDFQAPFFGSPIVDVHHLFSTSPKYDLGERRLELLEIYHKSLVKYLKLFEVEKEAPTLEQIQEDYENSKPFYYYMMLSMKPLFMNPTLAELEEILGKVEDPEERFLLIYQYDGEYFIKTMRRALVEMKENGYFR